MGKENIMNDDVAYHDQETSYRHNILTAWDDHDISKFHKLTSKLHASDIALIIGDIRTDERVDFLEKLADKNLIPEILVNLEDGLRTDILAKLPLSTIASYMEFLPSDDRITLIEDFSEDKQQKLLAILTPRIQTELTSGLEFDVETAGRIMRREFVSIPDGWNVGQAIDYLRYHGNKLSEFYNIIILNAGSEPIGLLLASKLLITNRDRNIHDIMDTEFKLIPVDMPQDVVSIFFRKYDLIENPVINSKGVLLGTITLDDVVDLIDAQGEEDLLNLAGVAEHAFHENVFQVARTRFSWLLINLFTAVLASLAIGIFEHALEEIVALAILMPIIASMGGNAGTQSLAVTVRALALQYLTNSTRVRLIMKEIYVGILNGVLFAILAAFVVYLWFGRLDLSIIVAFAMILNLAISNVAGVLIPLFLDHHQLDPAMGSTVILTTITDIVGFCVFLGMASWLLI